MSDPFSADEVKKLDPRNVNGAYMDWPSLAEAGFRTRVELPRGRFKRLFILGMGGSAAGGDILAGWLSTRTDVEIAVYKGVVPARDMKGTLAVACSASGETQETIEMLKTAVLRGATAVSISSGGRLEEVSRAVGVPHIKTPKIVAPRYMLPFILFSSLAVLNAGAGLDCDSEVEETVAQMRNVSKGNSLEVPTHRNGSKQLAVRLVSKVPAIYGSRVTRGAGIRFKNVLNENAKKHAVFDQMPDLFHNEIEAWEDPSREFIPVLLRHKEESGGDRKKAEAMSRILADLGAEPVEVRGLGRTSLSQLVTMVYELDLTSYYLALALGRDPFPTGLIDRLKRET